jgi:dipeptidyl aminopeptidase/acylaminoacyl peptidase
VCGWCFLLATPRAAPRTLVGRVERLLAMKGGLPRRHEAILVAVAVLLAIGTRPAFSQDRQALTVTDTVEMRRVLRSLGTDGWDDGIKLSPDRKHYVVAFTRGDVLNDGIWLEILTGDTRSIKSAQPRRVAQLFTTSRGLLNPTHIVQFRMEWLPDNDSVAFLWNNGVMPTQVVAVSISTSQQTILTHSATDVVTFDVSSTGKLLYSALLARDLSLKARLLKNGFAVENADAYSAVAGDIDGWNPWSNFDTFLMDISGSDEVHKIVLNGRTPDHWLRGRSHISPDGRFAIVEGSPAVFPKNWSYYSDPIMARWYRKQLIGLESENLISQLFVVDLDGGSAHPLWEAPTIVSSVLWSSDSRHVLLGPTFLPVADKKPTSDIDIDGLRGVAVAEIDVQTGAYSLIPTPPPADALHGFHPVTWVDNSTVKLESSGSSAVFTKGSGRWVRCEDCVSEKRQSSTDRISVYVREDLNEPPHLAASTGTGHEKLLYDPNPEIRNHRLLGRVVLRNWKDFRGRGWSGLLYFPPFYTPGEKYPLVIQTHGFSPHEFSLLGHESQSSTFAAQLLATRGFCVLQVQEPEAVDPGSAGTVREAQVAMDGFESAIDDLSQAGFVDANRVGLVGFSRTGWHVEYALSHSHVPYAAAIVSDNTDVNYLQYVLGSQFWQDFEGVVGGPPSGTELSKWADSAAGFNPEQINTPLRLELDSGGLPYILTQWEVFIRLRRLGKATELYVVPDVEHGVHGMVIPSQQIASRAGMVDWMDFWLNGREDSDDRKADQYRRWEKLCDQQIVSSLNLSYCVPSTSH